MRESGEQVTWPIGGTEMATRIRTHHWSETPLGPIERWPQSLRTIVELMLASPQPVSIAWGAERTSLYNDGYLSILGAKHPAALGRPYAEVWTEIWEEYRPLVMSTLNGETHHLVDHPVELAGGPDGGPRRVTFSWVPLRNEDGVVAGFYCAATETTDKSRADTTTHNERDERLRLAVEVAELGTWSWDLTNGTGEIDQRGAEIVGLASGDIPDVVSAQLSRIHPDDLAGIHAAISAGTGGNTSFSLDYRVVFDDGRIGYVASRARVLKNADGEPVLLVGTNRDVTTERETERKLRTSEARQAFLLGLSDRLRPMADSVDIMNTTAESVARYLGVAGSGYAEVLADGDSVAVGGGYSDGRMTDIRFRSYTLTDAGFGYGEMLRAGQDVVINDFATDPRANRDSDQMREVALRSALVTPLVKEDCLVAFFYVMDPDPRGWTDEERLLLQDAAQRTWAAVERARAEVALRRARDEAEQRRRLYETITSSTPDLIYVFDLNYQFIYANEALLAMWGLTWEESIGKRLLEVGYEPWHAEMHEREIDQIVVTRQPIRGEVSFPHATLGRRIYDYILVPVLNAEGHVEAVAGTTRDITSLRELSRQKDEFIGIASHELRTPVTSAKAFAQLMLRRARKAGDTASADLLAKMDSQLTKLSTLISDLLDVTQIEAGQLQFDEEPFDLDALISDIIDAVQPTTARHQIVQEGQVYARVWGDPGRTGQVLTNLLTNAIKYSPDADKIVVRTSGDRTVAIVSVQDAGVGIADQDRPRVFERFYRVGASTQDTFPGIGLGLFISAEIVRRQGGQIWVESEIGQGSTFSFTIPVWGGSATEGDAVPTHPPQLKAE